jgi:hypothetical protein
MNTYVALTADATGRYCHVYGTANTWHNYVDQLEDLGCEVVENQTYDYEDDLTPDGLEESGAVWINNLLTTTDFVSCS